MSILTNARIIRAYQFNSNQSNVVTHVVNEIPGSLRLRSGWQLIVIHLPLMFPVHPKDIGLPHTLSMANI